MESIHSFSNYAKHGHKVAYIYLYIYININSMPDFSLCVLKHTSFFKCLSYTEIMQKS